MMGGRVREVAKRRTAPLAEAMSRRGVARGADATRHLAGENMMILPSRQSFVQGRGGRWRGVAQALSLSADAMLRVRKG
jgi:hypothetical protein